MYDCKAPLSRFYYPDTRRIINAFIIIIYYYYLPGIFESHNIMTSIKFNFHFKQHTSVFFIT